MTWVHRTGLPNCVVRRQRYAAAVEPSDVAFAGAAKQARMLAAGTITAPALLETYLERIARCDPQLRAYRVVLTDSARAEAAAAQRGLDAGERLPLAGVPVAIKDDVDITGQTTTYGTGAHGPAATRGAEVVQRLRDAGAVIIGKTAVPELMMLPYTESLTYGATCNPWDTSRTPGGSSGGSAAAVAAGLVPLALGSDGGGSIRIPSSWCGLFGLKPQRDRISLAPHNEAWCGLSVNGPIARSVTDAALFLDATTTVPGPNGGFVTATAQNPGRLRIALSAKVPPPLLVRCGKAQRVAVDEAGALLRDLGHEVISRDPDYPPTAILGHYLPRCFRGISDDARSLPHPERLEARTRAMARIGRLISDRRMAACAGRADDRPDPVNLRRRRRCRHARHRDRPAPYRRLPTPRRGVEPATGRCPGSVFRDVEPHGSARRRGAVGIGRHRPAVIPAARRQAVRRGNIAGAQRADRGGETVGAPPAAGVMTAKSLARQPTCRPAA